MRILGLRGGAVGDFLVILPMLDLLRARWRDAVIELVGNARVAGLGGAPVISTPPIPKTRVAGAPCMATDPCRHRSPAGSPSSISP
jgi:hypothetical protein